MNTQTRSSILAAASLAIAAGVLRADILPSATPAATRQSIQDAIDAAAVADPVGTVTLGNGLFAIDAELMVTGGVTVVGQGWNDTIIKQTANGQRVATLDGGARLEGVTATGGRMSANWSHGAGLYVTDGTVSRCCISNNVHTGRNVHAGGVSIAKGTIDHSVVAFNQAGTYTSVGGGIGCYNTYGTIVIDTCLIYGNTVSVSDHYENSGGGGIGFASGGPDLSIRNTTITGNSGGGKGGGLRINGNKTKLVNCIVSGNTADTDDDIYGTPASGTSNNLIGGDPLFVNAQNNDYHLTGNSPAMGNGAAYEGIGNDLDSLAFATPPSIGCYEYFGAVAATPTFNPASGTTFYPSTQVTLSCATADATIHFTTNGSNPTTSSPVYNGPIAISATTTIKARAFAQSIGPSEIASATYLCVPTPSDFLKSVEITLGSALSETAITTGIPALVRLSESTISGFDYDDFSLANGGDMMFFDASGQPLPHEVDTWDASGESLVWVKLPSTAANTTITMYYGYGTRSTVSSTGVWNDYVGVWHFAEATAAAVANSHGTYANSTATAGIDGNVAQYAITGETGRLGKCFRVNDSTGSKTGNYQYGGVWVNDSGTDSPIDGGQNFTISGWFKHANYGYYWDHFFYKRQKSNNTGSPINAFAIESNSGSGTNPQIYPRGSSGTGAVALNENGGLIDTWAYITFVYDGTACRVYKDGVLKGSATIAACIDNNSPLVFGNNNDVASGLVGDAAWNGWIDEVRYAKGSKSATWIAAEFAAMNTSGTDIFTYGAAENVSSELPVDNPAFDPESDILFYPSTNVTISCATDGATIYYTVDGTDPTEASTPYSGPITLSATTTIKAFACKAGMRPSRIVEATYTHGVPMPPALGAITVTPRATAAVFSGEIASVGNNHATACDVYLALGADAESLGEWTLIASGATTSFGHVVSGLDLETAYYYGLIVSNNASIALGTTTNGQFSTTARQALEPVEGDPAATRNRIQEEIDFAVLESPAGTVLLGSGIFEIDVQLMVTGGVTVAGQGWDNTVIKQAATTYNANTRVVKIDGGAVVTNLTLTGGKVTGGNYQYGGGALIIDGTLSWCCVTNNSVYGNNTKFGGGVCIAEGHGQVDHCIIADNLASTQYGTAVGGGGIGVYKPYGDAIVDTCLIYGNRSVYTGTKVGFGGGVGVDFQRQNNLVTIRNSTIADNIAGEDGAEAVSGGGAVHSTGDSKSKLEMLNCIVADNTTINAGTTVQLEYAGGVDYCLFDIADDKLGDHSKVGNPKFRNKARGDYHPRSDSPAVNLADPEAVLSNIDLGGMERGRKPDAGCYEMLSDSTFIILK